MLTRSAADDLDRLPARDRVIADIKRLGGNPFPSGNEIKKLKGVSPPLYRLRSGDFRALFRVEGNTVTIMRVIDRKELDRAIRKLK
ncbi:MAG: type II toxin-antitoxin system RelE/ParE family toxin [Nitrospinae bacterium]|nr:type II toxin-antitoxin system RelE/ParE family toxin [Nitrospinota bacterium]